MSLGLVHFITAESTDDIQVVGGIENRRSGGIIKIEDEKIRFTAVSGTGFLNITRGVDGTTAVPHAAGTLVTVIATQSVGDVILSDNVIIMEDSGKPTDNITGFSEAQTGSLYCDRKNAKLYVNGGTKEIPAWKVVTSKPQTLNFDGTEASLTNLLENGFVEDSVGAIKVFNPDGTLTLSGGTSWSLTNLSLFMEKPYEVEARIFMHSNGSVGYPLWSMMAYNDAGDAVYLYPNDTDLYPGYPGHPYGGGYTPQVMLGCSSLYYEGNAWLIPPPLPSMWDAWRVWKMRMDSTANTVTWWIDNTELLTLSLGGLNPTFDRLAFSFNLNGYIDYVKIDYLKWS